jgi:hypothetical protein
VGAKMAVTMESCPSVGGPLPPEGSNGLDNDMETLLEISEMSPSEVEEIQNGNLYKSDVSFREFERRITEQLVMPYVKEKNKKKNALPPTTAAARAPTASTLFDGHTLTVNKRRKDNQGVRSLLSILE